MAVKKTTRTSRTIDADAVDLGTTPDTDAGGNDGGTFEDVATRVRERDSGMNPARKAALERHEKEILDVSGTVTVETAIRGVADLKVSIDATLDHLAESVVGQAKRLAQMREAAQILSCRIAEMHDIEVAADALANLVRDHEAKSRQFEADDAARMKNSEEQAAICKRACETEAAEARISWEKEKLAWRESFDAEKANARRDWQREQEEHGYAVKTLRTREEAEHQAARAAQTAELAEERLRQEKTLTEREDAVAARETEFAELRARVAGFQAEMDRAVQRACDEATATATEKAGHEADLRSREVEGEIRLLKQRIQTLESTGKDQAVRIVELQTELKEATDRVRDIAVRAIDGASGASALTRVNEIAMQQARARGEPKS